MINVSGIINLSDYNLVSLILCHTCYFHYLNLLDCFLVPVEVHIVTKKIRCFNS